MDGVRSIRRSLIVTVTCLACILTLVADVEADPVRLRNGTATFSQTINNFQGPDQAVDGIFDGPNGWAIARFDGFGGTNSETAVWQTATDVSAGTLVFTMYFLGEHLLGRFRFSATTDDRSTFADGRATDGAVDANWFVLTDPIVRGPAGMTFTTLPDQSVLAGGTPAVQGIYTVTYSTPVSGITGIRLEALEDPSLPGGNGPGLFARNGNFLLTELELDAIPDRSAELDQSVARLTNEVEQLQSSLDACRADDARLTGQVATLTSDNLALQSALEQANATLAHQNALVAAEMASLAADLRAAFGSPQFTLPGATPYAQLENVINAIRLLNHGRKEGLYVNLGGRP